MLKLLWRALTSAQDVADLWPVVVGLLGVTVTWWLAVTQGVPEWVFLPAALGAFLVVAHGVAAILPRIQRVLIAPLDVGIDISHECLVKVRNFHLNGGRQTNTLEVFIPITAISNHEDDAVTLELSARLFWRSASPSALDLEHLMRIDGSAELIPIDRKNAIRIPGGRKFDVPLLHLIKEPFVPDDLDPARGVELTWLDRNSKKHLVQEHPLRVFLPWGIGEYNFQALDLSAYLEHREAGLLPRLSECTENRPAALGPNPENE